MDRTSRSATSDDLKLVLKLLNEAGVEYMLVGGYALRAHRADRFTTDIDVLVPGTLDTGVKVIQALMALPDQVAKDMKPEWFTEGGTIRVADDFIVDVMTNANGHTYEASSPKHADLYLQCSASNHTIPRLRLLGGQTHFAQYVE